MPRGDQSGGGEPASVWLSVPEAATRLGVVPKSIYRFIDRGELKAYKMGRVIRLRESDVEAYLVDAEIQPGDLTHLYED